MEYKVLVDGLEALQHLTPEHRGGMCDCSVGGTLKIGALYTVGILFFFYHIIEMSY